jgi:hypothetical protein
LLQEAKKVRHQNSMANLVYQTFSPSPLSVQNTKLTKTLEYQNDPDFSNPTFWVHKNKQNHHHHNHHQNNTIIQPY